MPAKKKEGPGEGLEAVLDYLNAEFGEGSVMRMGDDPTMTVEVISTGILPLDLALGAGGFPRGRVVEIFGTEGSGKTTLALHAIAEAQREGGIAAFLDLENALDPAYAATLGVDVDDLIISQPDFGEQAIEIMLKLVDSGEIDIIVVDSVAALLPRAELEGASGDSHVGLHARLMSQALRKLTGTLNRNKAIVIFINQIREKIGVMYGSNETTPGGRALPFYSSVRLDVRRIEQIKNGVEIIGGKTRVNVKKNKVGIPFRKCEFNIMYGQGVDKLSCLVDIGEQFGVFTKGGAWYKYQGENVGQGHAKTAIWLDEHPEVIEEITEVALGKRELTEE